MVRNTANAVGMLCNPLTTAMGRDPLTVVWGLNKSVK